MKKTALILMGLVFFAGCIEKGPNGVSTTESPYYSETTTEINSETSSTSEVSVTFVVEVPEYTPEGDNIYIAGDFNG